MEPPPGTPVAPRSARCPAPAAPRPNDLICAPQLISSGEPPAAPNGGSAHVLRDAQRLGRAKASVSHDGRQGDGHDRRRSISSPRGRIVSAQLVASDCGWFTHRRKTERVKSTAFPITLRDKLTVMARRQGTADR